MGYLEIRIGENVVMEFPESWVRKELKGFKGAQKWMKLYPLIQESLASDDKGDE